MRVPGDAADPTPLTGILVAMEEEAGALRARLAEGRSASVRGARITLGRLGRARVALAVTGDGPRQARKICKRRIGRQRQD